jgi:hypothetical protein
MAAGSDRSCAKAPLKNYDENKNHRHEKQEGLRQGLSSGTTLKKNHRTKTSK